VAVVVWTRPPDSPLTLTQVQRLLPLGSTLHSLARLELDGRPPQEVAVVVIVRLHPEARAITYYSFVFAYNRWHREFVRVYEQSLPPIPVSVDAGRLLGDRDAAVFGGLDRHGTRFYRVVGWWNNKVRVVHEGRLSGNILVGDGLLIEDGIPRRVLVWDGHRLSQRPPQVYLTVTRASTWRYSVRNGKVVAHTSTVDLVPRQVLHVTRAGGGPTTAIVPDARLDLVEGGGYRARAPGIYAIRIVTPFVPVDQSYTLTVVIGTPAAP
jgi:hypothetical protein